MNTDCCKALAKDALWSTPVQCAVVHGCGRLKNPNSRLNELTVTSKKGRSVVVVIAANRSVETT